MLYVFQWERNDDGFKEISITIISSSYKLQKVWFVFILEILVHELIGYWEMAIIKWSLKFPLYFAVRTNSNCKTYIRENYDIYPHINVAQVWLHAVSCYWCYKENCRCFEMLIRKNGT